MHGAGVSAPDDSLSNVASLIFQGSCGVPSVTSEQQEALVGTAGTSVADAGPAGRRADAQARSCS